MDFEKLKKLAGETNGIVVMNGNTPELVILPYKDYQRLLREPAPPTEPKENVVEEVLQKEQENDDRLIESLNQEIEALRDKMTEAEPAVDL